MVSTEDAVWFSIWTVVQFSMQGVAYKKMQICTNKVPITDLGGQLYRVKYKLFIKIKDL